MKVNGRGLRLIYQSPEEVYISINSNRNINEKLIYILLHKYKTSVRQNPILEKHKEQ